MLKKINRLSARNDFLVVKEKGKLYYSPLFSWVVWRPENYHGQQFGVVVSKRISKKAVERNKIRRILMEIIRKRLKSFPSGVKVVILVRGVILRKHYDEIEKEVITLLSQW